MALIRKRLRVEMWMYERLQELYGAVSVTRTISHRNQTPELCHVILLLQDDIEIDLDEVLDMDDESDRRTYISVSCIALVLNLH